jgi:hypothetical protein
MRDAGLPETASGVVVSPSSTTVTVVSSGESYCLHLWSVHDRIDPESTTKDRIGTIHVHTESSMGLAYFGGTFLLRRSEC